MRNAFILLASFFLPAIISAQVVINEYCAANYDDIDFQMGPGQEYEDWIELYNTSGTAIDLTGYHLSDNLNNVTKWAFPLGTTINPNDHLLIVASNLNDNSYGELNTNFKLTQTKGDEYVIFSDPAGIIVDSIRLNYPNKMNHSRGRTTDGAATWSIFENPTMENPNTGASDGYIDVPVFDMVPGEYPAAINVALSNTSGAPIRYTTDGSEPDATSTLYTAPINVANTSVLKAITISNMPNMADSHVNFNTYLINENHTIRVISIAGDDIQTLLGGSQIEPIGSFEMFDANGVFEAEGTGDFNEHGNDSWAYPQRGIDWVTRDQLGNTYAIDADIFPSKNRGKFQRLILKAGASDNYPFENGGAHIRDPYVQMISVLGDLRLDERTYEPCVMYVNGMYWGVYEIREKADDHDFTDHYFDQDANNIQYLKTWGGTWEEYGEPDAQLDWDAFRNFVLSNDMSIQANYDTAKGQYNMGSLIDYFILNGYVVNSDWLNWNTAWWRGMDPAGEKRKWRYVLWDMDATFDHYANFTGVPNQGPNADPCDPEQLGNPGGEGHVPIWNALLASDEFFANYINRYAELSSSVFTCDSMIGLLNNMVGEIAPEMPRQIVRWGGTMTEWQGNVQDIRDFVNARCTFIATGIVDCYQPEISGPYTVTVDVDPPLTGNVELHTITPNSYPFEGTYFGGVDINVTATPEFGYIFDHWELNNGTLVPNLTTAAAQLAVTSDDTIIAHFLPDTFVYDTLIVIIDPPGAGTIDLDAVNISNFPHTEYAPDGNPILLDALPNAGYAFSDWEMMNNTPLPSAVSPNIVVTVGANDTIIVHFDLIPVDTITFIANPAGAGSLDIDGVNQAAFPYTEIFMSGTTTMLDAVPGAGWNFDSWTMDNNTAIPNNTSANINVTWGSNDTVYVNFTPIPVDTITFIVSPPGSGTIDINTMNQAVFPYTEIFTSGSTTNLSALPAAGFNFDNWVMSANAAIPNNTSPNVTVTWGANDTVFIHFSPIPMDTFVIMANPVGAGTVSFNGTNIAAFPSTQIVPSGSNITLDVTANANFTFENWSSNVVTINPNNTTPSASFNATGSDTITAVFDEYITDTIIVLMYPNNSATLTVGSNVITTTPFTVIEEVGTVLNISAVPNGANTFSSWELNTSVLPDYNPTTFFTVVDQDTLIAYLNWPVAIDQLGADINSLSIFPTVFNNSITVEYEMAENASIQTGIYDLSGSLIIDLGIKEVKSGVSYEETHSVEVPQGVYLIKIQTEQSAITYKIIKM